MATREYAEACGLGMLGMGAIELNHSLSLDGMEQP